jgi:putative membrane protein
MFVTDVFCAIVKVQRAAIMAQFHHMDGGMHTWHWVLGILVVIVCLGGIAALVYFLTRHTEQTPNIGSQHDETPLDTLKKRYARGEITQEDFDRMKKEL